MTGRVAVSVGETGAPAGPGGTPPRIAEAIRRFQGGGEEARDAAFRMLYETYFRPIQRFFFRRGVSPDDALDLTQETFLGIYKALETYEHRERFEAWLFQVAPGAGAGGPSPEEMLDYLEGRLSPEAEAALQRRLVATPAVTRDLLALVELVEAGEGEGVPDSDVADFEVRAGWRDFQRRLGEVAEGRKEPEPAGRSERTGASRGPDRGWVALAAALFVAVLALGVWNWQLHHAAGPGRDAGESSDVGARRRPAFGPDPGRRGGAGRRVSRRARRARRPLPGLSCGDRRTRARRSRADRRSPPGRRVRAPDVPPRPGGSGPLHPPPFRMRAGARDIEVWL